MKAWKCAVCGYIHTGDSPPAICPICGADRSLFTAVAAVAAGPRPSAAAGAAAWRCTICGYVHSGSGPPGACPVCGAERSLFSAVEKAAAAAEGPGGTMRIVIAGAGIAGASAAEHARLTAPEAAITVVSKEPGLPYFRLNLTRFLAGEVEERDLLMQDGEWFREKGIDLVHGEVRGVDREKKKVLLDGGRTLPYDRLVLACGAHPFVPPLPGADLDGVLSLRTIEDAHTLVERLVPGGRALCVGGGLLGLETAGALARRGMEVTLLEGSPTLLPRQLAPAAGLILERRVKDFGITVRTGVCIEEILGDKTVRGVLLEGGETIAGDLAVLATGVRPNSSLARRIGLAVRQGVFVDDGMITSDPDILACGDAAEHLGVVYGIWPAAYAQGVTAGINAAGGDARFTGMPPSNRLKVLDVNLFSVGRFLPPDAGYTVFEETEGEAYRRFVCRDGRIVGANLLGDTDLAVPVMEAVEKRTQIPELREILEKTPRFRIFCGLVPKAGNDRKQLKERTKEMASLKGTQTEKNLLASFAGESQARNRYTYAAGVARKAGFLQIAEIFMETAENEKEHAKRFFKFLEGGAVEITAAYPAGTIGDTAANLKAAAAGEKEEWSELYPAFAATAEKEGFMEVAAAYTMIAKAEKEHEERYLKLLENVERGKVFKKDAPVRWKCRNCGYVHEGPEAPEKCPACLHPQNYFEVKAENY